MSQKSGVQSLSFNAGYLVFSRIAEKGLRFIYLLVLARFLGPDLLGLFNYGLAWYLIFLPLAVWGLGPLLSMYLGKKPANAEDIVGATLIIRILATTLTAFLCFIIGFLSNDDLISRSLITIFTVALLGRSLTMWGRNCFIAVELSQYSAWLEIGFRLVEVIGGLAYLSFGGSIIGVCVIHTACWVVEGVVIFVLVRNRLSFRKILVPWSLVRSVALKGFPIAVNIFFLIALSQSGFVILKHMLIDVRALGFFTVAVQLVVNTALISEAIGSAALPILTRAHDRGTGEQIVFLEAMLKVCSLCAAVLIMFIIVFKTFIIRLLFGEEYLMASGALIICSIAMLTFYALPLANQVLNAGFKQALAAVNNGVALIANIGITILLVPTLKEKAPAFGLLVGSSIALMLHLIVIHKKIGKFSWTRSVIKPNITAILAIVVTWNLKQFGVLGLGAGLGILGICFAGWKMITPQEVGYINKLVPRFRQS